MRKIPEAIQYTNLAENELKKFPEVLRPEFPVQSLKFFDFSFPVMKFPADRSFVYGDNHIAYPLPTMNQYQYIYSLRAELYKAQGNLKEAISATTSFIEKAKEDNSKHGKETMISGLFRLGDLYYLMRNLEFAKKIYTNARDLKCSFHGQFERRFGRYQARIAFLPALAALIWVCRRYRPMK